MSYPPQTGESGTLSAQLLSGLSHGPCAHPKAQLELEQWQCAAATPGHCSKRAGLRAGLGRGGEASLLFFESQANCQQPVEQQEYVCSCLSSCAPDADWPLELPPCISSFTCT